MKTQSVAIGTSLDEGVEVEFQGNNSLGNNHHPTNDNDNDVEKAAHANNVDLTEETSVLGDTCHTATNESEEVAAEAKLKEEDAPPNKKPQKRRPWYHHPRITELHLKADWWTLWIGLLSFGLAVILVFCIQLDEENAKYVVPQPQPWKTNPLDAWNVYNLVGTPLLLLVLLGFYVVSLQAMGKLAKTIQVQPEDEGSPATTILRPLGQLPIYVQGYSAMAGLATLAFWLGSNEWCSEHGFGYAVFAIVVGMLVTNLPGLKPRTQWLQPAAKDGEYFIKCSLVLLAVELTVLVKVGGPAMIVTWIGSPLAIILGFALGMRLFECHDSLAMLIAVGASWCGASAISAVAPVVKASSEEVALSISVVAFFTVLFTFVQPYVAMAVGMPDRVAGAWIGGSVDQTGNVIVSAAIISEEATEVAGIVKMVLNAGMGVMASVIACYWSSCRLSPEEQEAEGKFSLIMLWEKFPKFTLGFIITSAILTGMMQELEGTLEAQALPRAVSTLNKWWFAIAFVGIGLTTDVKKLFQEAWKSGVIQVYLLANTLDIFLSLGLAYLSYGNLFEQDSK